MTRADVDVRGRRAALLLGAALPLLAGAPAPGAPEPAPAATQAASRVPHLEELLSRARRRSREHRGGPRAFAADPFQPIAEAGGLWKLRAELARAASALAAGDAAAARQAVSGVDTMPLLLPGLDEWVRLSADVSALSGPSAEAPAIERLLAFASASRYEPISRAALGAASRLCRTKEERGDVRSAWGAWGKDAKETPRSAIAAAVARSRIEEEEREAERRLVELIANVPDAPERAPDLFTREDRHRLDVGMRLAVPETRILRARAIVAREPDEAVALVQGLPPTDANRIASAEVYLLAGRYEYCLRALDSPAPVAVRPEEEPHVAVLRALAGLRSTEFLGRPRPAAHRARGRKARRTSPARPPTPAAAALLEPYAAELSRLLAGPLTESDERRVLSESVRLAAKLDRLDAARESLVRLLALSPSSSAGSEELFAAAFALYRQGGRDELLAAAKLWDEQAALYREVGARRRATYWSARARAKAGETDAARTLFASLTTGTSPDLYAQWSAAALGVPLAKGVAAPGDVEEEDELTADAPGSASRELLACGFPELAEDAAELEGDVSPLFLASLASERGDHRRASSLLKTRYPALGTPDEGAVPLSARRAFYPLAHAELVENAARESGLPAPLLFGLIRQESLFQPLVTSRAGAVGLMQVMPETGRFLLKLERHRGRPNLGDPSENVRLGVTYLARLYDMFGGDWPSALAAYNAGPGRVARWRREGKDLDPDELVESIPMSEPRNYVKKVLFFEGAYAALYGYPMEAPRPAAAPRTSPGA